MATIYDDDKLLQNQGMGATNTPANSAPLTGGASSVVGGGGGAQSGGAGAQPAWTNIQAYLKANQGAPSAADRFSTKANSVFDSEQSALTPYQGINPTALDTDYNKYNNYSNDQAYSAIKNWISPEAPAGGLSDESNAPAAPSTPKPKLHPLTGQPIEYKKPTSSKAKEDPYKYVEFLNQTYSPQDYGYQASADYSGIKDALGSDTAFGGYINDMTNAAAGGALSTGQRALQNQLDVSKGGSEAARAAALERLSGIESTANTTRDNYAQYNTKANELAGKQTAMRNYLSNDDEVRQWLESAGVR